MYYIYEKSTGEFSGSGLDAIDTEDYGSTEASCPTTAGNENAYWNGEQWYTALKNLNLATPRQIRLALIEHAIDLATIDTALAGNEVARVEWECALAIDRTHPVVSNMITLLELSPEQVNEIWSLARSL